MNYHQQKLSEFIAAGGSSLSEAVLGSKLAMTWYRLASQTSRVLDLVNRLKRCRTVYSHQVGVLSFKNTGFGLVGADIGGVTGSSTNADNDMTQVPSNDAVIAMHGVALEAATLAQVTGTGPGVSATTVLDKANQAGHKLYKGTTSNWNTGSSIQTALVTAGYSSTDMSNLYNWYIQYGNSVVIGGSPAESIGSWTGWAYWVYPNAGAFGIINGAFKGGTNEGDPKKKQDEEIEGFVKVIKFDPVDFSRGNFLYSASDISIGSGEFPYKLELLRQYDSRNRLVSSPLGAGWNHNFSGSLRVSSDGSFALGGATALMAASTLANLIVNLDLLSDTARPIDKLVAANATDAWWVDSLLNNCVVIESPIGSSVFAKLADGSFAPPPGNVGNLVANVGGTYALTTPQKVVYNYNASGQLTTIAFPFGVTVTLTYSAGKLTSISNGLGRAINFVYTGSLLTSVNDGTGRSVAYTVTSGNLVSFTDTNSKTTTYNYDIPGRLTKIFYPAFPSTAYLTNVYDSLGRIKTQSNAHGQVYTYYLAGSRSEEVDPVGNKSVTYFNQFGKVRKQINALGQVWTNSYDGIGRQVSSVNPEGNAVQHTYDSQNNILSTVHSPKPGSGLSNVSNVLTYDSIWNRAKTAQDGVGNITSYTYDAATGNLLTVQNPTVGGLLPIVRMKYNARGQMLSRVDESGIQTQFTFDATTEKLLTKIINTNWLCSIGGSVTVGNTLTITANDVGLSGGTKSKSYTVISGDTLAKIANGLANAINADSALSALGLFATANGATVSLCTSPGNTTTFTVSKSSGATETIGVSAGLNLTFVYSYDSVGNVTGIRGPRGYQTTFLFDAMRRRTKRTETSPYGYVTNWTYDDNGNVTQQDRQTGGTPAYQTFKWTYSASNKRLTFVDPASKTTTWTYDGRNRVQTKTDAEGRQWQFAYDALNRLSQATDPSLNVSDTRTYSANGKIASIKDGRLNTTQYTYDGFDRLNKIIYPDSTFEQNSSYDANGNVLTKIVRSGNSIVFTYDSLKRVVTKSPSGQPQVTYGYDLAGRMVSISKPVVSGDPSSGAITFTYDTAGRFSKETYPDAKTVTHVLDANGNRTKTTWPDGYFVDRVFDELDRLSNIKLNGAVTSAVVFTYNQLSMRTQLAFSNGASVVYNPQLNEDLTGVTHNFVGSNVSFTYGFDSVHEPTSTSISDGTYMWHPGSAGTLNYGVADSVNNYPTVGGISQTFDGNKNLTGDGTWTYGYDTENHLLSAVKTGTSASFVYDPLHRQSQKTVGTTKTRYVYSVSQRIADYDGVSGTLLNRYVFGDGRNEPLIAVSSAGVLSFLHHDRLGSIVATSHGTTGAIVNKNKFGPFGETATLSGTNFGYAGHRYDPELDLYYMGRRYQSPRLGRFLQADPAGNSSREPNLYSYALNNPFRYLDNNGYDATEVTFYPPQALGHPTDAHLGTPNSTDYGSAAEAAGAATEYAQAAHAASGYEYAGKIYKITNSETGEVSYRFSDPYTAQMRDRSNSDAAPIPPGAEDVGRYHTHGEGYDNPADELMGLGDKFSQQDIDFARNHDRIIYIQGPDGKVRMYDPANPPQDPYEGEVLGIPKEG